MAIADKTAYDNMLAFEYASINIQKNSLTTVAGRSFSSWLQAAGFPAAGAAPTTAAVPTEATTGALGGLDAAGATQRIMQTIIAWSSGTMGLVTIADRLSHQGGLSGTTTGAQTTNLPTAALTRHTSGIGVLAGLEIYTQVGTTGTTSTISYTNSTPTAGRTSPLMTFGATNHREASRIIFQPLQVGDKGVTAVASVTLAASTLTAGNFGVTLLYPLYSIPVYEALPMVVSEEALFGMGTWFPTFVDNTCLMAVYHTNGTSTGVVSATINTSLE